MPGSIDLHSLNCNIDISRPTFISKNSVTVSNSSQTRQFIDRDFIWVERITRQWCFSIMRRKFLTKSDEYTKASQKANLMHKLMRI